MIDEPFVITFFTDYAATTNRREAFTLEELAARIANTSAPTKEQLPWLKLATFGDVRSRHGSLRHDANMLSITGVEADYDAEKLSFDDAVAVIEKEPLEALIYTSPRHMREGHGSRWRILCPFSQDYPPPQREHFLNRLAGLFRDGNVTVLSAESWTRSQSYYFGAVAHNPEHRVKLIEGQRLDELDDLDLTALGKPGTKSTGPGEPAGPADEDALLDQIVTGKSYHTTAVRLLGVWARRGVAMLEAERRLREAFETAPLHDQRWQARVAEIPRLLGDIWSREARKKDAAAEELSDWEAQHPPPKVEQIGPRPSSGLDRVVTLVKGSDIEPIAIKWLWEGWLAAGKLAILAGAVATGKTTIAIAFAATITSGGRWPDGTRAEVGDVLVWSGEDDCEDTLLPRFLAAGGVRERIHFVRGVTEQGKARAFDPSTDMPALALAALSIASLKMIFVDPVVLVVAGDSHKNTEVRRSLQPLADLAATRSCAALGITHLTKGTAGHDPIERLSGSLAFGAGPRLVLMAAKPLDPDQKRRLVRIKSNIGPDGGGFEYSLMQEPLPGWDGLSGQKVVWGDALTGTAIELLNDIELPKDEEAAPKLSGAVGFLRGLLADGPVPVATIREDAEAAGHSWATVRRAQEELGVISGKDGFEVGWSWRLPGDVPPGGEIELDKAPKSARPDKHDVLDRIFMAIDRGLPPNGDGGVRYYSAEASSERAAWRVVKAHRPELSDSQAQAMVAKWIRDGGVLLLTEEGLRVHPMTRQGRGLAAAVPPGGETDL